MICGFGVKGILGIPGINDESLSKFKIVPGLKSHYVM